MKIGPFEILETLGGGGSGIVYKARHETLGRVVAIKHLNRQVQEGDRTFERFRREAQMMASIRSDHVVTLYSYQVFDGRPVLEMECLESGSLENVMSTGPMDLGAAMQTVEDILLGLKALHGTGIVHRDIKPANVLQDEMGRFKLSDFGLSVIESETKPTLEAATIRYVAPECISENPSCDFRSDLYSVGMVLYEGLLGVDGFRDAFPELTPAAAFGAKWLSWLRDLTKEATPLHILRPEIDGPVSQFAARLMAKDPEMRYASADAALAALTPLLGVRSVRTHPRVTAGRVGEAQPTTLPVERSRIRAYAAMTAALLVLSVGAIAVGARLRDPKPATSNQPKGAPSVATIQTKLLTRAVDEEGHTLPDVRLVLVPGNVQGRSAANGTFVFESLKPGTYELTASAPGRVVDVRKVTVDAQRHTEETVTLKTEGPAAAPKTLVSEPSVEPLEKPKGTIGPVKPASPAAPPATPPVTSSTKTSPQRVPNGSIVQRAAQPAASGVLTAASSTSTDLSRALAARLGELIKQRALKGRGVARVALTMSTRPAPFAGRGITADYVATVQTEAGSKSFQGQVLGFAELTLRNEVVDKAAADIAAHLGSRTQ